MVEAGGGVADALAHLPTAEFEMLQRELAAIHRFAYLFPSDSVGEAKSGLQCRSLQAMVVWISHGKHGCSDCDLSGHCQPSAIACLRRSRASEKPYQNLNHLLPDARPAGGAGAT